MTDSANLDGDRGDCESCKVLWPSRSEASGALLRAMCDLDRNLNRWMKTEVPEEKWYGFSLGCLRNVASWLLGLAKLVGRELCCHSAETRNVIDHARARLRAKKREEQGPGLKVPGSHSSPSAEAEDRVGPVGTMCPPARCDRGVQTRVTSCVDDVVGRDPMRPAEVGVQPSREPWESSTGERKKRRIRRRGARTTASAFSPSSDEEPSGVSSETGRGGDMPAAGPTAFEGRKQRGKRGEVALVTPPPPASGPSYAAAAASSGQSRPSPSAAAAGDPAGRAVGPVKVAPGGDAASRESRPSSPPLPRPEPKRKKMGMRILGSSVPIEIRFGVSEIDRNVTARDFSLVSVCGPEVLLLGPARSADAPFSPSSKEEAHR